MSGICSSKALSLWNMADFPPVLQTQSSLFLAVSWSELKVQLSCSSTGAMSLAFFKMFWTYGPVFTGLFQSTLQPELIWVCFYPRFPMPLCCFLEVWESGTFFVCFLPHVFVTTCTKVSGLTHTGSVTYEYCIPPQWNCAVLFFFNNGNHSTDVILCWFGVEGWQVELLVPFSLKI